MKILSITSGREINGATVYSQLLTRQLAAAGHEVKVLAREGSWLRSQLGRDFDYRESTLNRFPPSELSRIAAWILKERVDVIHTHMSRANTFGILLKFATGIPVVATAHNRYVQFHWAFNDFVIANSQATERYHLRYNFVRPSRIRTIHCFIDLDKFLATGPANRQYIRREWKYTDREFVMGVVGEVIERKGHWYLFQALPDLIRAIPHLRVVLIGRFHRSERYVRRLRAFQIKHEIHRHVRWLGRRQDMSNYLAALDLCVVPSIEEPLGLIAVEAQASGVPVVASNTGGLPEIVCDRETGLLVPPRSVAGLSEAILRAYRDPQLRARCAERARSTVAERFSPSRLTAEVVQVYEQVCQRRKHRAA